MYYTNFKLVKSSLDMSALGHVASRQLRSHRVSLGLVTLSLVQLSRVRSTQVNFYFKMQNLFLVISHCKSSRVLLC